jgi:hypothetical protein
MTGTDIHKIFEPIIGGFVWNAEQGHGSFLHLEFGSPKIEISTEQKPNQENEFPYNSHDSRNVTIKGEYSFFVYMSNWVIYAKNTELAYDESSRDTIDYALNFINGQKLLEIEINPNNSITKLNFDLGGSIKITNDTYSDELNEMWIFYTNSETALTFRNDGKIAFEKTNVEFGSEKFEPLNGIITCSNTRLAQ